MTIVRAPAVPATIDHPDAWAYEGFSRIRRLAEQQTMGHTDRWAPTLVMLGFLAPTPWQRTMLLLALREGSGGGERAVGDPDDVLGVAEVRLPLHDNLHAGTVFVTVHPHHRGRGIGSALLDAAERDLVARGRTTALSWNTFAPEPPPGRGSMTAPTGAGRVPSGSPDARFPLGRGFRLEQVARLSQLDVPTSVRSRATVVRLRDDAAVHAGADYRLHVFDRDVPEDWLAPFAALWTRMSTDIPTAEVDLGEDVWDAERVVGHLRTMREAHQQLLITAAEHVPTGDLVAFTVLQIPEPDVPFGFQDDTLVIAGHRGHRLGMLIKATNLLELVRRRPGVRRVHTDNAAENRWMLAINVALGFRGVGVTAAWQKQLARP